jgi:hypothetical protein
VNQNSAKLPLKTSMSSLSKNEIKLPLQNEFVRYSLSPLLTKHSIKINAKNQFREKHVRERK